jgi:hypothetical protein
MYSLTNTRGCTCGYSEYQGTSRTFGSSSSTSDNMRSASVAANGDVGLDEISRRFEKEFAWELNSTRLHVARDAARMERRAQLARPSTVALPLEQSMSRSHNVPGEAVSHVTRNMSHVTSNTSHVASNTSHGTSNTSHVTSNTSHVASNLSHEGSSQWSQPSGAPPGSLLSVLATRLVPELGSLDEVSLLWREVVKELRWHWDHLVPIPLDIAATAAAAAVTHLSHHSEGRDVATDEKDAAKTTRVR